MLALERHAAGFSPKVALKPSELDSAWHAREPCRLLGRPGNEPALQPASHGRFSLLGN